MKLRASYQTGMLTLAMGHENTREPSDAFRVEIDVTDIVSAMTKDDAAGFADAVLCSDALYQAALMRLADESVSWAGDDATTREEWLVKIGAAHARDVVQHDERAKRANEAAMAMFGRVLTTVRQCSEHMIEGQPLAACCRHALRALENAADMEVRCGSATVPSHDVSEPPVDAAGGES